MDEKQEDHPLWPAFMEWFASDAIAGIHFLSPAKVWRIWLAGARAAETARGGDMDTNRIRHKQITAKLDRNSVQLDRLLEPAENECSLAAARISYTKHAQLVARIDRILEMVEETGCANEVIAKLDQILERLESEAVETEAVKERLSK